MKAVSVGKATITATTKDSSRKTAKLKVSVVILSESISISGISQMASGGKQTLKATISPINATNKSVKWSSLNTDVATIDKNGAVTTKPVLASTQITIRAATMESKNLIAEYTITVLPRVTGV